MNFLEMEVGHLFLNTILSYNTSHQPKLYRQKRGKRAAIIRYCTIRSLQRRLCKNEGTCDDRSDWPTGSGESPDCQWALIISARFVITKRL